jgi:hypothetical protein
LYISGIDDFCDLGFILYRLRCLAVYEVVALLVAGGAKLIIGCDDDFANDVESGLMGCEAEHDEVSISSVDAVGLIGVICGRGSFLTDELHDLMLPFSRTVRVGKDYSEILP